MKRVSKSDDAPTKPLEASYLPASLLQSEPRVPRPKPPASPPSNGSAQRRSDGRRESRERSAAPPGASAAASQKPVSPKSLYRSEVVREMSRATLGGSILKLPTEWLAWTYWLLLFSLAGLIAFTILGRVHDWAEGPAIVRMSGRLDLTAMAPGTVSSIEVHAGEHVDANQLLVRFSGVPEQDALANVSTDFEAQLVKVLREPGDGPARGELARLRSQKKLAETKLAERVLRAPRAGVITDVRIRQGQLIQAGENVLTLVSDGARPQLIAILPGHTRPQIKVGTRLRFEPTKFEFAYQNVQIETIGEQVLGPSEVRRFLGPELADVLPITGPSLIVTASLPPDGFAADGKSFQYSHGLPGQARACLRTRSILKAFLPEARRLLTTNGDDAKGE